MTVTEIIQILLVPAFGFLLAISAYLNQRINRLHDRVNSWQLQTVQDHPTRSDFADLKNEIKSEFSGLRHDLGTYNSLLMRLIGQSEGSKQRHAD